MFRMEETNSDYAPLLHKHECPYCGRCYGDSCHVTFYRTECEGCFHKRNAPRAVFAEGGEGARR